MNRTERLLTSGFPRFEGGNKSSISIAAASLTTIAAIQLVIPRLLASNFPLKYPNLSRLIGSVTENFVSHWLMVSCFMGVAQGLIIDCPIRTTEAFERKAEAWIQESGPGDEKAIRQEAVERFKAIIRKEAIIRNTLLAMLQNSAKHLLGEEVKFPVHDIGFTYEKQPLDKMTISLPENSAVPMFFHETCTLVRVSCNVGKLEPPKNLITDSSGVASLDLTSSNLESISLTQFYKQFPSSCPALSRLSLCGDKMQPLPPVMCRLNPSKAEVQHNGGMLYVCFREGPRPLRIELEQRVRWWLFCHQANATLDLEPQRRRNAEFDGDFNVGSPPPRGLVVGLGEDASAILNTRLASLEVQERWLNDESQKQLATVVGLALTEIASNMPLCTRFAQKLRDASRNNTADDQFLEELVEYVPEEQQSAWMGVVSPLLSMSNQSKSKSARKKT